MNLIAAKEIKRRGLKAVDDQIHKGDLHVIRNNKAEYVVMSEDRYSELLAAEQEAHIYRVKASLEEIKAGKSRTFASTAELLKTIEEYKE